MGRRKLLCENGLAAPVEPGVKHRANRTHLNGDWAWSCLCMAVVTRSSLQGFTHRGFGASRDFYSLPQRMPMRKSNSRLRLVKIKPYCHLVDSEFILLIFFGFFFFKYWAWFFNSKPDRPPCWTRGCVSHHCKVYSKLLSWQQFYKTIVCSNLLKKNIKYCTKHEG